MAAWPRQNEVCADANGLALQGFDPVSYFAGGPPARGRPEHALVWRGAVFHFGGTMTQRLFLRWPERFAPQYGGHCAFALATGELDEGDPSAWRVLRARLYLFTDGEAAQLWCLQLPENVRASDAHWARLLHENALR
jgi:hypothetical protein